MLLWLPEFPLQLSWIHYFPSLGEAAGLLGGTKLSPRTQAGCDPMQCQTAQGGRGNR